MKKHGEIMSYIEDHPIHLALIIGGVIVVVWGIAAHNSAVANANTATAAGDPSATNPNSPYGYPGSGGGWGGGGGGAGGWWQRVLNVAGHWSGTGKNRTWVPATYTRQWE